MAARRAVEWIGIFEGLAVPLDMNIRLFLTCAGGSNSPLVSWLLLIADHCISHFMADCGLHCFQQAVQPHLHLCVCVCVRERETELMIANWEFVGGHKMTPVSHDALHCEHALLSMLIHNLPPKHEQ